MNGTEFTLVPLTISPLDLATLCGLACDVIQSSLEWADQHTADLRQSREIEFKDLVYSRALLLRDVLERVQKLENASEVLTQMKERASDRQFQRIQENYRIESWRESMDDRRHMLIFASVQSFKLDLTIAQAARAERTLREIDPSDLAVLKGSSRGES